MRHITTLLFLIISTFLFAQENNSKTEKPEAGVTKSMFGIQVGTLGTWVYNESRLSNKIALRSELGLQTFTSTDLSTKKTYNFLTPEIVLEPRYYYNLEKRSSKGKSIERNSGNYFSLRSSYFPDLFKIGSNGGFKFIPELNIIPTWGMKRNLGTHFNYELGGGLGYRKVFETSRNQNKSNEDAVFYLHARIGYTF